MQTGDNMFDKLEKYINENEYKIIAIDGPSGAGKSSLAKRLEEAFNVLVVHTDNYFLHPSMKTESRLNEPGGNIDYVRLENEVFSNLDKEFITSNFYNCQTNELEEREPLKKTSIIIVEGVYSLHPKFIKYYDYTVFLDVDITTQLERISKRSGDQLLSRYIQEWIPLENRYFNEFKVKNQVNLYINNNYK
jgi:uridine kinase